MQTAQRRMPSTSRTDLLRLQLQMSEEARRIGGRIRELRKALPGEPSQATMAAKLPGNVQGAEWSRWETGRHRPHSERLEEIAGLLSTSVADLIAGPVEDRKPKAETPDPFASPLEATDDELRQVLARVAERQAELLSKVDQVLAEQERLRRQQPPDESSQEEPSGN